MNSRTPSLITAVLASSGVVVALMQTIILPLLPLLPGITGAPPADAGWAVTATLLSGAICTPLFGRAGDMYGKRRVLLLSLLFLIAGSVVCTAGTHLPALIAGRLLQGVGLAVTPLAISILRDELPPGRVASAVALMSATIGIGAAVGLPIAAVVVQYASWRALFWACAVAGLAVFALIRWIVPESPVRSPGRFDIPGAAGLSAFLVCLLLAISKGPSWGLTAPPTLGLAAFALATLAWWIRRELRVPEPLVDLRTATRPAALVAHLVALFIGFAFYANTLATAQLVQEPASTGYGLELSIVAAGLCLLPGGLCLALLSPVSARITDRKGPRTAVALASAVIAVGYVVRFFTSHELWTVIVGATVVAIGSGLAYSALPMLIMRAVPVTETAAANGQNVLMRMIGQAASSAAATAVLAHHTAGGRPTLHAYLLVFLIAASVAVAALATALAAPRRSPAPVPATA
ncbi:MFS transporter [Actinocorallia sp. B10E7]|uniref:MFS transporter n=1 Tax=Actinocorallia sp. B10E7 TaxID=3153558 RepID=UPI00325DDD21